LRRSALAGGSLFTLGLGSRLRLQPSEQLGLLAELLFECDLFAFVRLDPALQIVTLHSRELKAILQILDVQKSHLQRGLGSLVGGARFAELTLQRDDL